MYQVRPVPQGDLTSPPGRTHFTEGRNLVWSWHESLGRTSKEKHSDEAKKALRVVWSSLRIKSERVGTMRAAEDDGPKHTGKSSHFSWQVLW